MYIALIAQSSHRYDHNDEGCGMWNTTLLQSPNVALLTIVLWYYSSMYVRYVHNCRLEYYSSLY